MIWVLLSYFMVGLALAADASSVSLVYGSSFQPFQWRKAAVPAVSFGAAQAIMPAIGWLCGSFIQRYVEAFGHWIAFGILMILGVKFIIDSRREEQEEIRIGFLAILLAAFATSIDALAVGFSLAMDQKPILVPAAIFGVVTFACSMIACRIGAKLGEKFGPKLLLIGGIILIGIGVKIVVV